MAIRNPASLRVREGSGSTVDIGGIVTLVFPNGTIRDAGNGTALLTLLSSTEAVILRFSPTLGNGSISTFPFYPPIGVLVAPIIGGLVNDPGDFTVDGSGQLVLGPLIIPPGDPAQLQKVGAFYKAKTP